jgi:hypothetical protein
MIPADASLAVDFAEIEIPRTADEKMKENEFKLAKGMTSIIELMKEQNPDLTDEEAEEMIKKNLEVNKKYV